MARSTYAAAIIAAAILSLCLATLGQAAVPDNLSYQGFLTDSIGSPINGDTQITFAIYNVPSGGGGPLWTVTKTIPVDQGLFSVVLGTDVLFPLGLFDDPLWLGIAVGADAEMIPRRALTSAAFAFKADDALTLTGQTASALNQSVHVTDLTNPHVVNAAQAGAASSVDIADLQAQLDAALETISQLEIDLASEVANRIFAVSAEETRRIADDLAEANARVAADSTHDNSIANIQANTVLALDHLLTLSGGDTALFEGVNVQVVSGGGATNSAINGLGNLIVGYNAPRATNSDKGGSHNLIVGDNHNYLSYGGLVAGFENTVSSQWSSVTGGGLNEARGSTSVVGGGSENTASGNGSVVMAGRSNQAFAFASAVSGGYNNQARGNYSSVAGGGGGSPETGNTAFGDFSAILGGASNVAGDPALLDHSIGIRSTISGGFENNTSNWHASVAGGQNNVASGSAAIVVGGGGPNAEDGNEAFADYSAILGGLSKFVGDPLLIDHTIGQQSTSVFGSSGGGVYVSSLLVDGNDVSSSAEPTIGFARTRRGVIGAWSGDGTRPELVGEPDHDDIVLIIYYPADTGSPLEGWLDSILTGRQDYRQVSIVLRDEAVEFEFPAKPVRVERYSVSGPTLLTREIIYLKIHTPLNPEQPPLPFNWRWEFSSTNPPFGSGGPYDININGYIFSGNFSMPPIQYYDGNIEILDELFLLDVGFGEVFASVLHLAINNLTDAVIGSDFSLEISRDGNIVFGDICMVTSVYSLSPTGFGRIGIVCRDSL